MQFNAGAFGRTVQGAETSRSTHTRAEATVVEKLPTSGLVLELGRAPYLVLSHKGFCGPRPRVVSLMEEMTSLIY